MISIISQCLFLMICKSYHKVNMSGSKENKNSQLCVCEKSWKRLIQLQSCNPSLESQNWKIKPSFFPHIILGVWFITFKCLRLPLPYLVSDKRKRCPPSPLSWPKVGAGQKFVEFPEKCVFLLSRSAFYIIIWILPKIFNVRKSNYFIWKAFSFHNLFFK